MQLMLTPAVAYVMAWYLTVDKLYNDLIKAHMVKYLLFMFWISSY